MTANSRDEKPEIHASKSIANVIKLLQPAVFRLITILDDLFIAVWFIWPQLCTPAFWFI